MRNQPSTINHQPSRADWLVPAAMILAALLLGTLIMGVADAEVNSEVSGIAYDGNGTSKTFTFPFGILATSELRVVVRTVATGAETLLVLNSGYSMTDDDGDGDYTDQPGGSITTLAADAYSSAYEIWITRKPALTQTTSIDDVGYLRLDALEDTVDKLTYEVQYLRRLLYRVPIIPETEAQVADMNLPASPTRASGFLKFTAAGGVTTATVVEPVTTVTTYWETRLGTDTSAAEVRTALDAQEAEPNLDDAADGLFNHGITVKNGATGAGFLRLYEDSDDGTNYADINVPALAANVKWKLPAAAGVGYWLSDANGNLTIDTPAGGGDMLAATYDTDSNDIVDYAQEANSVQDKDFGDVNVVSGVWHADDLIGTAASKSNNTAYLAATAGFAIAITSNGATQLYGYTDSSNPPTTIMARNYGNGGSPPVSITMPVKKGNYWKVTGAITVYWIPLGS